METLEDLLGSRGLDPNSVDTETGRSLLHRAVAEGAARCVDALAAHGGDVNEWIVGEGQTLLHMAVSSGRLAVVETLLARGSKLQHARDYGIRYEFTCRTPLHVAACGLLRREIAEPIIEALLRSSTTTGGPSLSPGVVDARDGDGLSVLHYAIERQLSVQVIESIVLHGGSLPSTQQAGMSAMQHLVNSSRTPERFAEVYGFLASSAHSAQESPRFLPLQLAASLGRPWLVRQLLALGADVSRSSDEYHINWLDHPTEYGRNNRHASVVPRLLTALHVAASFGDSESTRALLDGGAAVDAVDHNQRNPLHQATGSTSSMQTLTTLLGVGAPWEAAARLALDCRDGDGHTPYHVALMAGNLDMALHLLDRGVLMNSASTSTNQHWPVSNCPILIAQMHWFAADNDGGSGGCYFEFAEELAARGLQCPPVQEWTGAIANGFDKYLRGERFKAAIQRGLDQRYNAKKIIELLLAHKIFGDYSQTPIEGIVAGYAQATYDDWSRGEHPAV